MGQLRTANKRHKRAVAIALRNANAAAAQEALQRVTPAKAEA